MQINPLLVLTLALAACNTGPSPRLLTGSGVTPAVWGILDAPSTPGPHPGVILIPGSAGWRPGYEKLAKAFTDSGFVALTIDYYAVTGRGDTKAEEIANWPAWQATIRNAVTWLEGTPEVAGRQRIRGRGPSSS